MFACPARRFIRACAGNALKKPRPGTTKTVHSSQREERFDQLDARLTQEQREELSSYPDLWWYGTEPHACFSVGFERLPTYTLGINNIRDIVPFPRLPNNASF